MSATKTEQTLTPAPKSVLQSRNFRLLFAGQAISNIGDQFAFIALPWLVLHLTNNPILMASVLALAGIPRAGLMLFGGALSDRFSARLVMLLSDGIRMILMAIMAVLILSGHVQLWMVYAIALLFGTADAFFIPSMTSIVTQISPPEELQKANTITQGMNQLSQFVGPVLAGVVISYFEAAHRHHLEGIGIAMAIDAITFLVSVITLYLLQVPPSHPHSENVLELIKSGLDYVWHDVAQRYLLVAVAMINFLLVGPFIIGTPVMARYRLHGGPLAYGIIISAWGIGALIGFILAGVLPKPKPEQRVRVLLTACGCMGICMILIAFAHSTLVFTLISLVMSIFIGYVTISFLTLIQQNTPPKMMGRIMSIIMFCTVGTLPVSELIAGFLLRFTTGGMYIGSGVLLLGTVLFIGQVPEVKAYGLKLVDVRAKTSIVG